MPMSKHDPTLARKFREIIIPQIRPEMANTLADMLGSNANFQHNPSAIEYVLRKLWTSDLDPRS